jgi:esterase/lipase superfamily enzyme
MRLDGAEPLILQKISDLQSDPTTFVPDHLIATATQMELDDVRLWLETLENKGLIDRARLSQGFSASLTARGRAELRNREPIPVRSPTPPPPRPAPVTHRGISGKSLIVGVSNYPDPIPVLPAVAADVREIAKLLGSENGSFQERDVLLLAEKDARRESILNALEKVFREALPDDTLFVYLAGHGAIQEDAFYFVAFDSQVGQLDKTGVPLATIKSLFDQTKSERVFLWLDCCHSGGIAARGLSAEAEDRQVLERTLKVIKGQGKLIIAACMPRQKAYEDSRIGHGLFTAALLRGLKGEAATTGEVTALSLYEFIDREMGSDRQRPMLFGQATGRVVLVHYPSPEVTQTPREFSFPAEKEPRLYAVWYGTNRRPNDPADPARGFSGQRDDRVHYGTCNVSIPKSHRFGSVGSNWWRRWLRWTDDRLKVVSQIWMDSDAFWQQLGATFRECPEDERQGLVFLHGFNVTFEDAAIRTAQIGFDLKVPGATAFFSWPSCGTIAGYPVDEASIEASEQAIATFLRDFVTRSGAQRVHLIAHSMGNRGLLRALQRLAAAVSLPPQVRFGQIILAAPDVDQAVFGSLAENYARFGQRTTLYASPADRAVGASQWLHGYPRVGLTPPVLVVNGIDTVEVPQFNIFDLLGHGYFAESEALLHDIFDLIRRNPVPADRQRLEAAQTTAGLPYWVMRQ